MIESKILHDFQEYVTSAQKVLVVYPDKPSYDVFAAAVAVAEALVGQGKEVRLVAPSKGEEKHTVEWDGLNETTTEIGNENLTVSFAYSPEQVDKVSYHIGEESGRFYLTIKPQKGHPPLDTDTVEYSYNGASADLIILVGVNDLENLLQLYFGYEELYRDTASISINTYDTNFGTQKLNISKYSSYSEAVSRLINDLGLTLSADQATNLLQGIDISTKGFQSLSTTAETFETVARLLRAGARRQRPKQEESKSESQSTGTQSLPPATNPFEIRPSSKRGSNSVSFSVQDNSTRSQNQAQDTQNQNSQKSKNKSKKQKNKNSN